MQGETTDNDTKLLSEISQNVSQYNIDEIE